MFKSFRKGLLDGLVDRFSNAIKVSDQYKYFSKNDSSMIKEYKDFETVLISSALAFISFKMNINDNEDKNLIRDIYLKKIAGFGKKILSQEYKCWIFNLNQISRLGPEHWLIQDIDKIFYKYLNEISNAFILNSAEYYHQYESPYTNQFDEVITGETRNFDFVLNLFLAEERYDFENEDYNTDKYIIGYKYEGELNAVEKNLLNNFIEVLRNLKES